MFYQFGKLIIPATVHHIDSLQGLHNAQHTISAGVYIVLLSHLMLVNKDMSLVMLEKWLDNPMELINQI